MTTLKYLIHADVAGPIVAGLSSNPLLNILAAAQDVPQIIDTNNKIK
jgi:hypothetical protein